jgi:hypothetical protein
LAIAKLKLKLLMGGGGGGVLGGTEAIDPSKGVAAVDYDGEESSSILPKDLRWDDSELRVHSVVT